jgi:anti-sigma-K factor RskA
MMLCLGLRLPRSLPRLLMRPPLAFHSLRIWRSASLVMSLSAVIAMLLAWFFVTCHRTFLCSLNSQHSETLLQSQTSRQRAC